MFLFILNFSPGYVKDIDEIPQIFDNDNDNGHNSDNDDDPWKKLTVTGPEHDIYSDVPITQKKKRNVSM